MLIHSMNAKETGKQILALTLASMQIENNQANLSESDGTKALYGHVKIRAVPHLREILQMSSLSA